MSNHNMAPGGVPSSSVPVSATAVGSSSSSSGNTNVGGQLEVMDLTAASMRDFQSHKSMLIDMEAKKRAFQVDVPTLPHDVRTALRNIGLPVRLFGENLANVRDRLRMELARRLVLQETQDAAASGMTTKKEPADESAAARRQQLLEEQEEQVTKYSRATQELITARERICQYSLERSQQRLAKERTYRVQWQRKRSRLANSLLKDKEQFMDNDDDEDEDNIINRLDDSCFKCYKSLRKLGLEGSQYGDARPLSCIATSRHSVAGYSAIAATASWSGTIKIWDGTSPELNLLGEKTMAHEDRIMGIAVRPPPRPSNDNNNSGTDSTMIATASIDLTAKLWKVQRRVDDAMEIELSNNSTSSSSTLTVQEVAHLKGHAARLCSVAFHPLGDYVVTTSFDHTWRLWDVESGSQVLLQDGHWKEVYGVGFHPDGSLCATTDYGSVVHVWDLRTGKSICHFVGQHAKRVLCSEFSPNGFQLATSGDDGTIKIWDLRTRKQFASIPAHSNLVTQLRFDTNNSNDGEFLTSSSFDGTAKVWSTRDWKILSTLRGHQGKVMGVDTLPNRTVVTCGFDKTIKLWR